MGLDIVFVSLAYVVAFVLRMGFEVLESHGDVILPTAPVLGVLTAATFLWLGIYRSFTRFAGIEIALKVFKGVTIANLIFVTFLVLINRFEGIPRGVIIINWMANILVTGGARFAWRALIQARIGAQSGGRGVLVYGSVEDSEGLLREFDKGALDGLQPVGLVDPDPKRHGRRIHGVYIYGGEGSIEAAVKEPSIEDIHFVGKLPSKEIVEKFLFLTENRPIRFRTIPLASDAIRNGEVAWGQARDLRIEDLLRREPKDLDLEGIHQFIYGQVALVTGAGGSIGSELVAQIASNQPRMLVLVEASEEKLHRINQVMRREHPNVEIRGYLADSTDAAAMRQIFVQHKPDLIFHAAAFKHVDLVEMNPCQGIVNNIEGLNVPASLAAEHRAKAFVFVSTDKAARPVNLMGATKRLGECLVKTLAEKSDCKFVTVRFGNVLGSSGSVVPVFREQILNGGPVTVTHPEMTRFFMLPSEAVQLILQAASLGESGKVYVLDMGDPVSIERLARDMIRLLGRIPDKDIPIVYIGLRPGEKLHEELYFPGNKRDTRFSGTWEDNYVPEQSLPPTSENLKKLVSLARAGRTREAIRFLKELVPEFAPMYEGTQKFLTESDSDS
ncbi:MAG: nucleoside-diphosphate sugar epimerase/dehydratase [Planctomycetota bacterium]|nr:nucleoside-diphosphate sugar epimerase/dehydratase [Planctomycetota bacterium]